MKSRKIKTSGKVYAMSAPPSRAHERMLGDYLGLMLSRFGSRFKSTVTNKIGKKTARMFADDGYFAEPEQEEPQEEQTYYELLLLLLLLWRRKAKEQYDDERIQQDVKAVLKRVETLNSTILTKAISEATGISPAQLKPDAETVNKIDALEQQAIDAIKKIRDDTLADMQAQVLKLAAQGETPAEIQKQIDELVTKRTRRAELSAQNQIDFTNSMITKVRAQGLGIRMAVWITMRDEKVRRTHEDRHGQEFTLARGCWSPLDQKYILPGEEYNCRCVYKLIMPPNI
jgi:SPP1 gp7 family putative phage head morphogenesis protein